VETSCIILAGGRSRRFKKDKALLILNGRPLINHVLRIMKKFFSDIIIVVKNEEQREKIKKIIRSRKIKVVEDKGKIYSPVAGIKEGVKHIKNNYVFVIACDMPFLNEKTIKDLIPRAEEKVDLIAYFWALHKYEPLCAIYKKKLFKKIRRNKGLQKLIEQTKNKVLVPISRETLVFFNVNTKEDLDYARRTIKRDLKKLLYKI
jgi:molybdopterin-guanine dinucleotide biosynthesis protein A